METFRRSRRSRLAFTLIEVLVVIAVTSLLAGLILTYSSTSRDQVALYVQQAKLAQTIAKAKSLTISTYNKPTVPCGYGVHMDYPGGAYTLFSYDAPSCDDLSVLNPAFETTVTAETLPSNLVFGTPDAGSIDDILFIPPNPDTWVWLHGSNTTSTAGQVPIMARSGAPKLTVTVSSAGQISF